MQELNVYAIAGLYDEMYYPDVKSLCLDPLHPIGLMSLQRASSLFWAQHLSENRVKDLIDRVHAMYRYTSCSVPQYEAVIEDPSTFISKVVQAPEILANQSISPQTFFSSIETLTILCNMYSEFLYRPFKLTLEEGFLLNEYSSKSLIEDSLNPITNPYFNFIMEHCWPIVEIVHPEVIWIVGPIRVSSFTIAMLARQAWPTVHISVVQHSSEYYSLNKIAKYLKQNDLLFSIIDSVILDDSEYTQKRVFAHLNSGTSFDTIPNLLYIERDVGEIVQTKFQPSQKVVNNWVGRRPRSFEAAEPKDVIDPSEIVNVKLWPDAKCFWCRCTFCGINHKYHTLPDENRFEDIESRATFVSELVDSGSRYLWLIDEAVPPDVLVAFAKSLLDHGVKIIWQARSKIDEGFTQDTCEFLASAGLREIRLGLESASPRILRLMDKFPENFDLGIIERIVRGFHENGVSVHFPVIFGFPTENHRERLDTFEFLQDLKNRYPSMTFNINALGLDVSSILFRRYEQFDVTEIKWPCPAKYFLGNLLDWNSSVEHFDKDAIDYLREGIMRQLLYPWMPTTKMTSSFIFYRLSETSRITLIWKAGKSRSQANQIPEFELESAVFTSPSIVFTQINRIRLEADVLYRVYDWDSHNYLECDIDGRRLLEIFQKRSTVADGLRVFQKQFHPENLTMQQVVEKYLPQLRLAYQKGFLQVAGQEGLS